MVKMIWVLALVAVWGLTACSSAEKRAYDKEYQKASAEKSQQELSQETEKLK